MALKRIATVGVGTPYQDADYIEFNSTQTLSDYDVIYFKPEFSGMKSKLTTRENKSVLYPESSFTIVSRCNHWRQELQDAVSHGATVFIFLPKKDELFISLDSSTTFNGSKLESHHQYLFSNYDAIPFNIRFSIASGSNVILNAQYRATFERYAERLKDYLKFEVVIESLQVDPIFTTQKAKKVVAGVYAPTDQKGKVVLLPQVDFEHSEDSDTWTKAEKDFAKIFFDITLAISRELSVSIAEETAPDWAVSAAYRTPQEVEIQTKIRSNLDLMEKLTKTSDELEQQLVDAGTIRRLLFATGKPLELEIRKSLVLLGFAVDRFTDGESEFDAVFVSDEGRFVGEVEGKDTSAVNITKLRQLNLNIHEDLMREEVTSPAKAVLFGNGYRLTPLEERETQFTEKCITVAKTTNTALVSSSSLYFVIRKLIEGADPSYIVRCREALLTQSGIVEFPEA